MVICKSAGRGGGLFLRCCNCHFATAVKSHWKLFRSFCRCGDIQLCSGRVIKNPIKYPRQPAQSSSYICRETSGLKIVETIGLHKPVNICLHVYLSACPSDWLSLCLSVAYLSIFLSVSLPVCLPVWLSVCLFVCLSPISVCRMPLRLSLCPCRPVCLCLLPVSLSACLSVACFSVFLPACLAVSLSPYLILFINLISPGSHP